MPYRGFIVMRTTRSMRAPGATVNRNFCNMIASEIFSTWIANIAPTRITTEHAIKFIHQFPDDRGMLCKKEDRPRQRAGGSFEAGSEKNCRLTDQLGVSHATVFIVTRLDQEGKHIGAIRGIAPTFLHQCKNLAFYSLGVLEQPMIWRAGNIDRKEPDRSGKVSARPNFQQMCDPICIARFVAEQHRARDP